MVSFTDKDLIECLCIPPSNPLYFPLFISALSFFPFPPPSFLSFSLIHSHILSSLCPPFHLSLFIFPPSLFIPPGLLVVFITLSLSFCSFLLLSHHPFPHTLISSFSNSPSPSTSLMSFHSAVSVSLSLFLFTFSPPFTLPPSLICSCLISYHIPSLYRDNKNVCNEIYGQKPLYWCRCHVTITWWKPDCQPRFLQHNKLKCMNRSKNVHKSINNRQSFHSQHQWTLTITPAPPFHQFIVSCSDECWRALL